jgi:hypothetical protein
MSEALTHEDLTVLRAVFPPQAHEFRNGFVYIAEEWVAGRIESVDPAFNFEVISTYCRDKQAIVVAKLTIKGSTRTNTGMQMLEYVRDKTTKQPTDTESGEAEKGATTDAFKRSARLFGVGRYLLTAPKNLDEKSLVKWLDMLKSLKAPGGNNPPAQQPPIPQSQPPQLSTPAANGSTPKPPVWWKHVIDTVKLLPHFGGQPKHVINALNKMIGDGEIMESWAASEVIAAVKAKYDTDEAPAHEYDENSIPF